MRAIKYLCLVIAVSFPVILHAGQIYGSVISGGKGVSQAAFEINCKGTISKGQTGTDGSYRIDVPQEGQCTFAMPSYADRPVVIFSNPGPSTYNFDLVLRELRRR